MGLDRWRRHRPLEHHAEHEEMVIHRQAGRCSQHRNECTFEFHWLRETWILRSQPAVAVALTVLPEEYSAVRRYLTHCASQTHTKEPRTKLETSLREKVTLFPKGCVRHSSGKRCRSGLKVHSAVSLQWEMKALKG